jgi:hypothetical protein
MNYLKEQNHGPNLNDGEFIAVQESVIAEKRKMMEFLAQDIALMQRIREKSSDRTLKFEINTCIALTQGYIKCLGDSLEFNRTMIDGQKNGNTGGSDNLLARDEGRAEGEARAGPGADEPPTLTGQSDRGIHAGGVNYDLWADKAREMLETGDENPFL